MRIRLLYLSFISLFVFLGASLFYLQILKGPFYRLMSYKNSIRLINIPAPRGVIYDRSMKVLAEDVLSFGVFIVPQEADNINQVIMKISKVLGVEEDALRKNYQRNYLAPFAPCELIRNITKVNAITIQEMALGMPGVLVREIPLRIYPYKDAFAQVVGYVGEIDREELDAFREYGYIAKDIIGKDGIERIKDSMLHGRKGGMQIQIDNRGRQVKVLSNRKTERGRDVYLTLDASLQEFVWGLMKDEAGSCIIMDCRTGEVLTMLSVPSYDPNLGVLGVLANKYSPLLNRAIMGQYPPGSIFKLVIAISGLETGSITPDITFECKGALNIGSNSFHCWNRDGHGQVNLEKAITESCNVYFYKVGMLLGLEKITEYARYFGFGKKAGIELFGEEAGFLPTRAWKKLIQKDRWYTGDTLNLAIGQGYLLATPLQVTCLISSIANGMEYIQPYIIKQDADKIIRTKLKFKDDFLEIIKSGMKNVTEGERGTGAQARSSLISIAGKTGTSQSGTLGRTHAWFGGFAPSDSPEIAIIVFLEHGGSGGDLAALIGKQAIEYWYKNREQ